MCGIAGVLHKQDTDRPAFTGQALLTMAACLQHRGMDSAGIAVFAAESSGLRLQVMLPAEEALPEPKSILALGGGRLFDLRPDRAGFSASVRPAPPSAAGEEALLANLEMIREVERMLPGATVSSLGAFLTVQKAVGLAEGLNDSAGALTGTHGIAHLRLATESRIDPAHAQPFWGRPFPDVAVTHNGHITNYHKLRQKFEAMGFGFASQNDSEIIGIYLGRKLAQGRTLHEALSEASHELDGSYSFIVASKDGLGVARDPFATKPLLYVETDEQVALASEPQALHRLLGQEALIKEIRPREVRVWEKNSYGRGSEDV